MRNVSGGFIADCSAKCFDGSTVSCSGAHCNATDASGITDGSCGVTGESPKTCKSKVAN